MLTNRLITLFIPLVVAVIGILALTSLPSNPQRLAAAAAPAASTADFHIASWDNEHAVLTGTYNTSTLAITKITLVSTSAVNCVATAVGPDGQTVIYQATLVAGTYSWNLPRGAASMYMDPIQQELVPNWTLTIVSLNGGG